MKQLFTAFLIIITLSGFSQNTTEEEYNYLVHEYWKDLRTLSVKMGYMFDKRFKKDISIPREQQTCGPYMDKKDYYIQVNDFVRYKDKSLAGVLIMVVPQHTYDSYYFAIPLGCTDENNEAAKQCYLKLTEAFNSRLEYMNSDMKAAVRQVLAERDLKYGTNYKEMIK